MSPRTVPMVVVAGAVLSGAMVQLGGMSGVCEAQTDATPSSGFGVSVGTDKVAYSAGEPLAMELRVFNRTGQPAALQFTSGQRFDFAITDTDGKEAWRWSQGRMFTMALGSETVGPGKTELVFRETFTGTLAPGRYKLTGSVSARNMPMAASLTVEVR